MAPTLIANTGAAVASGGEIVITQAMLEYQDDVSEPADVTYTLTATPENGVLSHTTFGDFGQDDTFTQADIGNIVYTHDGSATTSDSFGFSVEDEDENVVEDLTFAITVSSGGGRRRRRGRFFGIPG